MNNSNYLEKVSINLGLQFLKKKTEVYVSRIEVQEIVDLYSYNFRFAIKGNTIRIYFAFFASLFWNGMMFSSYATKISYNCFSRAVCRAMPPIQSL